MPRVLQIQEDDDQEDKIDEHVGQRNLPAVAELLLGQGVELFRHRNAQRKN